MNMTEEQERAVRAGLRTLGANTRGAGASRHVERAVLAAFNERRVPATRYSFVALAAGLLLVVAAAVWMARADRPVRPVAVQPGGFVAVPDAAILPDMESANIVRVSLPVAALPVYGVAIPAEVSTDSVQAELLVAQDGRARAIRLVDRSIDSRSMSND